MQVHGTFSHPALGAVNAPAGIIGDGTLRLVPNGLEVVGRKSSSTAMSVFGLLGAFVGMLLAVAVGIIAKSHNVDTSTVGFVLFFGGAIGGAAFGKVVIKPKPITATIGFQNITKIQVFGGQLSFLSWGDPKGTIHFATPDVQGLGALVATIAQANPRSVQG
jgi:hypothetical protein